MPPKEQASQRSSGSSRSESQSRRPVTSRQLITFVDSQDPNSRSTIQRHTAHHSNAQRRDARLQSLRRNRPRLLEWQRRPSAETDAVSVTSPQSSASSTSVSPAPGLRAPLSAPGDISTELGHSNASNSSPEKHTPPEPSVAEGSSAGIIPYVDDGTIQNYLQDFCALTSKAHLREVINYIENAGTASKCLLVAYILACRGSEGNTETTEGDRNDAQRLYGQATRLLRDRLTTPETASSNGNIQAVLLLIAYASDTGSAEEVQWHLDALSRMVEARGGLEALEAEIDPILWLQVRAISHSRARHLTLDCGPACSYGLRFPNGLAIFDMQDKT